MKVKRFLSLVVAAAMTMQCAVVSVLAAESTSPSWKMAFNDWERLEPAFNYYGDWTVTDGLTINHDGDKHKAIKDVVYYMTQDSSTKTWTVYNETEPKSDYQAWYDKDAEGNPVARGTEGSTPQMWYRKGRPNYWATFDVGEKENNGEPIVISFDYKSTNSATGAWVNGPNTAFNIYCDNGTTDKNLIFSLYNNADGKGFAVAYGVTNASNSAKTDTVKKYLTTGWDYDAEHSVKVVISPELTSEGRYQMTAIELDGKVIELEGITGITQNEKNVLIKYIAYSSGANINTDYTDTVKNMKVMRGFTPITVTSSVEDGANDVTDKNIALTFSDAVKLADGAVKVYENGTEINNYAVTMGEDNKTANIELASYKSNAKYRVVVDKTLVSGLLGGELAEGLDISFTAAVIRNVIASDKTTDWKIVWNWSKYEDGIKYHTDYSNEDGLKFVNYGDKYADLESKKFLSSVETKNGVTTITYDENGSTYAFATDADNNVVAYDADNADNLTLHAWRTATKNWDYYEATFNVGEKSNNGEPIVVEFDYKAVNPGHETWNSGKISFLGFNLYPNFEGTLVSKQLGIGLNENADQTNYRQNPAQKIPVAEGTTMEDWHSVKCIISPEVASNEKAQMTAIEVDGTVTELEGIYGKAVSDNNGIFIDKIEARLNFANKNRSLEIKNLNVIRGIDDIFVTSSVEDGATDVTPENITLTFSDAVELADGAIKVYENGTEMLSGYTAVLGADNKTVTVNIPAYKSRAAYKITVDNTLVNGLLGGALTESKEINFISAKKAAILDGTTENLAEGYTLEVGGYGPAGNKFTKIETDTDGVTTITVDNDTWNKVKNAEINSGKTGTQELEYDLNGNGVIDKKENRNDPADERFGYADSSWNIGEIKINNISDKKQSTEPLVISMEYSFENAGNNKNDIWVNMGDYSKNSSGKLSAGGTLMYMITPFGARPNISGSSWDGISYTSYNVTEKDWHTVQYVIDPTVDENNRTNVTQITLDGEVIKETSGKWSSYNPAPEENAENGQYINSLSMRIKSVTDSTDANGAYLPTVLKIKNLKVLRAKDFTVATDSDALTKTENTLEVRFSDPVSETELEKLKVLKGTEVVDNAITAVDLASDGKSAKLTMNLDATAKYVLDASYVSNVYGVKSSTSMIEFEYYNTQGGFVTITNASKDDNGTDTTVSFTFTASKDVSPLVIVAAYGEDLSLMGVDTKPVDLPSGIEVTDSIKLKKVTGATKIQIMAWDSLEGMTPYCIAKDLY